MTTAAGPFAGGQPAFVTGKPVDYPGDRRFRDRIAHVPLVIVRIVLAQARKVGALPVRIDVGDWLVRPFGPAPQPGPDDGNPWAVVLDKASADLRGQNVQNADDVGLVQRPERSFPDDQPSAIRDHLEIRVEPPHVLGLVADRQDHWTSSPPKKVCARVGLATGSMAGAATPAAARPSRPAPGRW